MSSHWSKFSIVILYEYNANLNNIDTRVIFRDAICLQNVTNPNTLTIVALVESCGYLIYDQHKKYNLLKRSLKISKGPMEAVNQRKCNAKGKRKGQTIINKILSRKLKIAQHERMCFGKVSSFCHHLTAPVMLQLGYFHS
jgi:hypothetical protein